MFLDWCRIESSQGGIMIFIVLSAGLLSKSHAFLWNHGIVLYVLSDRIVPVMQYSLHETMTMYRGRLTVALL